MYRKLKLNLDTIKKQEVEIKDRDLKITTLESTISKNKVQLNEYEKMIRELEDKLDELIHEKKEEERFDIVRVQANTIFEKDNEIERLTTLLDKERNKNINIEVNDQVIINTTQAHTPQACLPLGL